MNSILVGKDAQKVAALDWAEEMRKAGWWVDINTRLNCEYVMAQCGCLSTAREVEASGGDIVTALIALMKAWDAIYGEAAKLDREWKAFVEVVNENGEVKEYESLSGKSVTFVNFCEFEFHARDKTKELSRKMAMKQFAMLRTGLSNE